MIRAATLFAVLLATPASADPLPINPDVTQATIGATICRSGWTRTIRPAHGRMRRIKREMLRAANEPRSRASAYQLDHRIPLTLGGSPMARENIALQPINEARAKDAIETCLSQAVCRHAIALRAAQAAIQTDWRAAAKFCTLNGDR